jgi:hypothetical protein
MIKRVKKGLDGRQVIELIPETPEEESNLLAAALTGAIDGSDSFNDQPEDDEGPAEEDGE